MCMHVESCTSCKPVYLYVHATITAQQQAALPHKRDKSSLVSLTPNLTQMGSDVLLSAATIAPKLRT
jgi:hypothetical protein